LFEKSAEKIILGFFALEIQVGELHLEIGDVEQLDKEEECENGLKDTSDIRNCIQ